MAIYTAVECQHIIAIYTAAVPEQIQTINTAAVCPHKTAIYKAAIQEPNRLYILKPSSNRSPNIFILVQKVKIGKTKIFNSKDKSRLCRDITDYFISK